VRILKSFSDEATSRAEKSLLIVHTLFFLSLRMLKRIMLLRSELTDS